MREYHSTFIFSRHLSPLVPAQVSRMPVQVFSAVRVGGFIKKKEPEAPFCVMAAPLSYFHYFMFLEREHFISFFYESVCYFLHVFLECVKLVF